ncbi:hypothetical protein BGZ80_004894 [Entomortierella chlamydospora]|uniref:RNI-like protein n=1 Tax=Entomortierella chlamydospora TaxID=101097 RepID=A0A9P6N139_9FUNG|nr:hypothetical protein BGZ79_007588 [Entomortierella chlamydospora]KAG0020022.1 hypothetical protein BGZ80_004894 [Entomortierella chlamydospora]
MPNLVDLEATWMNVDLLESLPYLQNLERLTISRLQGSHSEDNTYFEPSFEGSRWIRELSMTDSGQMTDRALVSITQACPGIQVLIVSGNRCLTQDGLIEWCHRLTLKAKDSGSLSTFDSLTLGTNPHPPTTTTELTTINFKNCGRIGSAGFKALFERSHHLEHVNLMSTWVEDDALEVLAAQNKGLQIINLNCCPAISDQGLKNLLRTCTKLRTMSFLSCNRVTAQVFFQGLWRCLGLEELRFSLARWHLNLIENGPSGAPVQQHSDNVNPSVSQDDGQGETQESPQALLNALTNNNQPTFYEPQLELMIFGGPEPENADDDKPSNITDNTSNNNGGDSFASSINTTPMLNLESVETSLHAYAASSTTLQEYRQRLILAQIYRQIERLTFLQILDIRDLRLPLDLASGLGRLGGLERLKTLEITGLESPMGEPEVNWLIGPGLEQDSHVRKVHPLPSLRQLAFKKGQGIPKEYLHRLKEYRPHLEVECS